MRTLVAGLAHDHACLDIIAQMEALRMLSLMKC
jgi:hypothetical protein